MNLCKLTGLGNGVFRICTQLRTNHPWPVHPLHWWEREGTATRVLQSPFSVLVVKPLSHLLPRVLSPHHLGNIPIHGDIPPEASTPDSSSPSSAPAKGC